MYSPLVLRHFTVRTGALLVAVAVTALFAAAGLLAASAEPPSVEGVSSSSHPNPTRWYKDPYPALHWQSVGDPAAYSWLLTKTATSTPDDIAEPVNGDIHFARTDHALGVTLSDIALGEFDNDGREDLATLSDWDADTVTILLGNSDGSFSVAGDFVPGSDASAICVADFDGDGAHDLATANHGTETVTVLLGDGSGGFSRVGEFASGESPCRIAAADFNGDGAPDLVALNSDGASVSVLLGNGDGTLAPRTDFILSAFPCDVALDDFDGDGAVDLAVVQGLWGDDEVIVLLGDGEGGFVEQSGPSMPVGELAGSIVVGDFNDDGKQDLATANRATVSVLLGYGDGTFADAVDFETSEWPRSIAVGDMNGDGSEDIVTAHPEAWAVDILLGDGFGGFPDRIGAGAGKLTASVVVGDFDDDGRDDMATANYSATSLSVLLNTRDTVAGFGPRSDGTWYFHICAVDGEGGRGPTSSLALNIDTRGPTTRAPLAASVRRYATAALKYRVEDPRPGSPTATVTIKIKNSKGVVVKTLRPGVKTVNATYYAKFVCKLAAGTYRFHVYATDQATNAQVKIGSNKLVVK